VIVVLMPVTLVAANQASWYGESQRSLAMAKGHLFNPDSLTASSCFCPLGSKVVVNYARRSVVVEITDRGPVKRLVHEERVRSTRTGPPLRNWPQPLLAHYRTATVHRPPRSNYTLPPVVITV
jgi:hypothetical protein